MAVEKRHGGTMRYLVPGLLGVINACPGVSTGTLRELCITPINDEFDSRSSGLRRQGAMLTMDSVQVQLGRLARSEYVKVVDDQWRLTGKGRKKLAAEKPWKYQRAVRTMFRDD